MVVAGLGGFKVMIIVLKQGASQEQISHVESKIQEKGLKSHISQGEFKTLIGVIGDESLIDIQHFKAIDAVEDVLPILKPYKLASREFKKEDTVIKINGAKIGGGDFAIMAGPCAIESETQLMATARAVKEEGIELLKKAKQETGLVTETEVMDVRQVDYLSKNVDILRIGSRNMQNY